MIDRTLNEFHYGSDGDVICDAPSNSQTEKSYWNGFYRNNLATFVPSQFAAMTLSEMWRFDHFVDCGCGNGRDSLFFASNGKTVLAIDCSREALSAARQEAERRDLQCIDFKQVDFSRIDRNPLVEFSDRLARCVVYARFFLHSIDEITERKFLEYFGNAIGKGSMMCVEFRTKTDADLPKVAAPHFRRHMNPEEFIQKIDPNIFRVTYMNTGFGLAKYHEEDAHVARIFLEKIK